MMTSGSLQLNNRRFVTFGAHPDTAAGDGAPALPVEAVTLGIPPGVHVRAEVLDPVYQVTDGQDVAPCPRIVQDKNGETHEEFFIDPAAYGRSGWFPSFTVSVGNQFVFRQQRACVIKLFPYQYDPSARKLRRLVRATIQVTFSGGALQSSASGSSSPDPLGEQAYRGLLLNYDQAKQWRTVPVLHRTSGEVDSTRSWFDPGRPYLKVAIPSDGWYRIRKSDLAAVGINPSGVDFPSMRLMQMGKDIPGLVEGDSACSFYARRNYGDASFFDFFTDTSWVWLSWNGTPGARFAAASVPGGSGSPVVSAPLTNHQEVNTNYYLGTGLEEITQTEDVPGEGWVWEYYYPGTTISHSFTADHPDTTTVKTIAIRARLYGTTVSSASPDHSAQIQLNGTVIGQSDFNGRELAMPQLTVPASLLRDGGNSLTITSLTTPAVINQFYLDWFDVTYPRLLSAVNDQALYHMAGDPGDRLKRFRVGGLTTTDVVVLDVSGGRLFVPDSLVATPTNGPYAVVFRDTVSVERTYLVIARSQMKTPPDIEQKQFADIRAHAGADYIVITHPLFKGQAVELAQQRASTRGIRSAVIDVRDIYDEFNFGVENASAMKSFLRYAYRNWSVPAPASVLLFGDATWDPHKYLSSSVSNNFIPVHGVPSGDEWFVCFDTTNTFIPSMFIGRLPVTSVLQAQNTVAKVIAYDQVGTGLWDKTFLLMTDGDNDGEKADFNGKSDDLINTYVRPAPVGGIPVSAYKSSVSVIDGSLMPFLRQTVKDGVAMINFIGHSGGTFWGLDIGDPGTLGNTNGWWPFVASVSCNVSAFAEPSGPDLSELFVLANHQGAIGMWGSASLGYPVTGTALVGLFLDQIVNQQVRDFGTLTTNARMRLWELTGSNSITIAHQFLTPLLGDPLSRFALPTRPDLALQAGAITTNPEAPTTADSTVRVKTIISNYGLVSDSPASLKATDTHDGKTSPLTGDLTAPIVYAIDSVTIPWHPAGAAGLHTIGVTISLPDSVQEVSLANNMLSVDKYVFANALHVIRPIPGSVVAPGSVRLIVGSQAGSVRNGDRYFFEIDTTASFNSPMHVSSPAITPGAVSGEWLSPVLPDSTLFFWRARTVNPSSSGRYLNATFRTSFAAPAPPVVRWQQQDSTEFAGDVGSSVSVTNGGVTIAKNSSTYLECHSVGSHASTSGFGYYTTIKIGLDLVRGYWWAIGNSYMAVKVNGFDGTYVFKNFDLVGDPTMADSMASFLNGAPNGFFIGIVALASGRTNVTESMFVAFESLGATKIRSIQDGVCYALIAQKGAPGAVLEALGPDSAVVSRSLPTFYGTGKGSILSPPLPAASVWKTFGWNIENVHGSTASAALVLGFRADGRRDTLLTLPSDSAHASLNPVNASARKYSSLGFAAMLTTTDAAQTPRLHLWSADFIPPPDVSVAGVTPAVDAVVPRGSVVTIPLSVFNLGYRRVDSTRIDVGVFDQQNILNHVLSQKASGIGVDSSITVSVAIPTETLPRRVALEISAAADDSSGDLFPDNNGVAVSFTVSGTPQGAIEVFADGLPVLNGDYVSSRPKIQIRPHMTVVGSGLRSSVFLFVDGQPVDPDVRSGNDVGLFLFQPALSTGRHEFRSVYVVGGDSVDRVVSVNVTDETKILSLYNYPNPFTHATDFTFELTRAPDRVVIRVYTVAGRKIREIVPSPGQVQIGANRFRVPWDGRDQDGDEIANGVYFYQVQVSAGDKTVTAIGKIARVR